MSDNHEYLSAGNSGGNTQLAGQVLILMLKGAGYAMIFCLALWFLIEVIAGIGKLLPEDSRFTPDPTPYSFHFVTDDTVAQV